MKDKNFVTTIKKEFLKMKLVDCGQDSFFYEYKDAKPFWNIRISNLLKQQYPIYGMFLMGTTITNVLITEIKQIKIEEVPQKYKKALTKEYVWRLKCYRIIDNE